MENIYSEHEASVKNGGAHPKLGAGNGHTDSHADKARPFKLRCSRPLKGTSSTAQDVTTNLIWQLQCAASHSSTHNLADVHRSQLAAPRLMKTCKMIMLGT